MSHLPPAVIERARSQPITDVWVRLGLPNVKPGSKVRSPFRDDRHPSAQVGGERNIVYDHATGETLDTIDLVRKVEHLQFAEAVAYVLDQPIESLSTEDDLPPPQSRDAIETLAAIRGWAVAALRAMDCCSRNNQAPAEVLFPMRLASGETTGHRRRRADNKPFSNGAKALSTKGGGSGLLGPQPIPPDGPVLLVEGEADAAAALSAGHDAVVATPGSSVSQPVCQALTTELAGRTVIMAPDPDTPGRTWTAKLAPLLEGAGCTVKIIEPSSSDLDEQLRDEPDRTALLKTLLATARPFAEIADTAVRDPLTELQAARLLAQYNALKLRHTKALGWLEWSGASWTRSEKAARRAITNLSAHYWKMVASTHDRDEAARVWSFAKRVESANMQDAVLKIAATQPPLDAEDVKWDDKPWLLACPNGTLDLTTGQLRDPNPLDHLTRLCSTEYEPDAVCPRWEQFLREVFNDDADMVNYFQSVAGYCLSGSVDWQCFWILHGSGCNGKSVLVNTLQHVLGPELSRQLDSEEILHQHHARHSTEIAGLRGARLVITAETTGGRRLNEALVKTLTGGDRMRARFMRADSFEFVPVLKLMLTTNHKPAVRDDSRGLWRRVRLLPFEVSFENRANHKLPAELISESQGILAWAVRGAIRAKSGEPALPKAVTDATKSYENEQDTLSAFLEECTQTDEFGMVGKGELYRAYHGWSAGRCESKIAFGKRLTERGFDDARTPKGSSRVWLGISLLDKELEWFSDKN